MYYSPGLILFFPYARLPDTFLRDTVQPHLYFTGPSSGKNGPHKEGGLRGLASDRFFRVPLPLKIGLVG